MTIYIKNMVCVRCKMIVQSILDGLAIDYTVIELGRVKLVKALTHDQEKKLNDLLRRYKLELMDDKRKITVERIKTLILEMLCTSKSEIQLKLSVYLSQALNYDYTYLSNTFSEIEGNTIERFYITTRVERVKELIVYEGLSVTEIAYELNFSSVSHLCLQFKKVTGLTPSMFKKLCESEDYVWKTCE